MLDRKKIDADSDGYYKILAERFIHFYNVINSKRDSELNQDYIETLLDSEIRSTNMLYDLEAASNSFDQCPECDKDKKWKLRNIILCMPLDIRLKLYDYFIQNGPMETLKLWAHVEGDVFE